MGVGKKIIKAFVPYGFLALYRKYKQKQNVKESSVIFEWVMTKNEQLLFKQYVSGVKTYLEFGSGGSTIAALECINGHVFSIESSADWIHNIYEKYDAIKSALKNGQLQLIHVDIGPVVMWGCPKDANNEQERIKFPNYSNSIFNDGEAKNADVVLIDGRFRVACCLSVLMSIKSDGIIMIHDYWNRPEYHVVLKYIDIIDGVDSLMVCKIKKGNSIKEMTDDYNKYKYNFE